MPWSWCHLSAAANLLPPSRCDHPDAIVLTQLYWRHPLNATLLIQPFSCCYPQTALLMLLSSHCHWKFIVAYKKWSAKTILNELTLFRVSWKKERHKWLETKKFKKLVFLTAPSWYHCPDAIVLTLPSQGNHSDAAVMTSLSWGRCPHITILRKPSWCHPPDTAILMLLSSTCPSHARILTLSPNFYCCM